MDMYNRNISYKREEPEMNEKRPYLEPELEVIELCEDILTTSNWINEEDPFPQP